MKSLAELQAIRDKARAQISVREGQEEWNSHFGGYGYLRNCRRCTPGFNCFY